LQQQALILRISIFSPANVILPWKLNVHQATNISAGDSIQWTWQDDLPHALISE
jgi:hypothetical protein